MSIKRNYYPMGSLSHGTTRPEDLIPCFLGELESLAKFSHLLCVKTRKQHLALVKEIEARIETQAE
jgi:hypothetical protein